MLRRLPPQKNRKFLFLAGLSVLSLAGGQSVSAREMTEYPKIKLRALDKITAHTMTFEAKVGSTLKFGSIYLKVQSCQKSSPIDQPESAAFVQIWETSPDQEKKAQWVFSGWMFASSPALSSMDHPIYDVWVIECLDDGTLAKPAEESVITPPTPPQGTTASEIDTEAEPAEQTAPIPQHEEEAPLD